MTLLITLRSTKLAGAITASSSENEKSDFGALKTPLSNTPNAELANRPRVVFILGGPGAGEEGR